MNPNQQDYSFITQGGGSSPLRSFAPKSQKQRITMLALAGGVVLLLIIVVMVIVNLFGSNNSKKLSDLAATQNEVQRIMDLGVAGASSSSVRALAQTASSTLASQKQRTINIASDKGIKITEKQLASSKKVKIDNLLQTAKNSNNFDDTFSKVYEDEITSYYSKLKTLVSSEGDKTVKTALVDYANNTAVLSLNYKPKTTN